MSETPSVGDRLRETVESLRQARAERGIAVTPIAERSVEDERLEQWLPRIWPRFRKACLDDFEPSVQQAAAKALQSNANVIIAGSVGVGKTHLAVAMLRAMHLGGVSVHFTPVVDLLDALRPEGGGIPESVTKAAWLLLDDLGAEKTSDWTMERLYMVVNRRWLNDKPTIITTNMAREDLVASVGARTTSRVLDGATRIVLQGGDRRA